MRPLTSFNDAFPWLRCSHVLAGKRRGVIELVYANYMQTAARIEKLKNELC